MKSNDAYGRLVECLFPNHIRLSIHSHSNVEKVGVMMMKMTAGSDMQWGTPWHNCAVLRKNGDWELVRKNVARVRGYELRYTEDEDKLPYYLEGDHPLPSQEEQPEDGSIESGCTQIFIGDVIHEATGIYTHPKVSMAHSLSLSPLRGGITRILCPSRHSEGDGVLSTQEATVLACLRSIQYTQGGCLGSRQLERGESLRWSGAGRIPQEKDMMLY